MNRTLRNNGVTVDATVDPQLITLHNYDRRTVLLKPCRRVVIRSIVLMLIQLRNVQFIYYQTSGIEGQKSSLLAAISPKLGRSHIAVWKAHSISLVSLHRMAPLLLLESVSVLPVSCLF